MGKQEKLKISFEHLADPTTQPEGLRQVYQLQLDPNSERTIVEGPLFLDVSKDRPSEILMQEVDTLFANQLRLYTSKDVLL